MKINEVMPNLMIDGGIFKGLTILTQLDPMTAQQLGVMYNFHSGEKTPNSLVKTYVDDDGHVTTSGETLITTLLDNMFGDKWYKLWKLMCNTSYDPISNYDRKELTTVFHSGYDTEAHEAQINSLTQGQQQNSSTKGQQTNTNTQSTVPFDNLNEVEAGENTIVDGQRQDSETLGSRSDSQTLGAHSIDTIYNSDVVTDGEIIGNIGVTTTQQMMQGEIDIRQYNIIEQIFKDVDSFIALRIYS